MSDKKLKIIFMGTPEFSVPALRNLIANPSFSVMAVYTRAPRPAGRGQQIRPSPVQIVADEHKIPAYTPKSFKKDTEAVTFFQSLNADIAVVAAYGLILPKTVLDAPRFGCLNIHASLLPRWRGAAPIQRAIEAGDTETGITIMQMEEGLDTGPMLQKKSVGIHSTTTASSLHDELSALGSAMIEDVLESILSGLSPTAEMQDDALSCYAPMLKKEEGLINWYQSAEKIDLQIRAFTPWPGCYTLNSQGKRIKILSGYPVSPSSNAANSIGVLQSADGDVSCGTGVYRVTMLQPENSKPMDIKSALNGKKISIGDIWGQN
jgi:methionyl-tRNA formyltransferase